MGPRSMYNEAPELGREAMPQNCNAMGDEADLSGKGAEGTGPQAPRLHSVINVYFFQLLKRSVLPGT